MTLAAAVGLQGSLTVNAGAAGAAARQPWFPLDTEVVSVMVPVGCVHVYVIETGAGAVPQGGE